MEDKINTQLKDAMFAKDSRKLNVLRQIKTAISTAKLNSGSINAAITTNEVLNIVRKLAKQREDSIEQFTKGGREDLVQVEREELEVLQSFLPKSLTESEIDSIIRSAIDDTQATSKKQMGLAIKRAQELADGRIDNKTISQKIGQLLQ